ncbi:MAG: arginine--tRNA ligase [Candidatus Woesearchaeota archaeon]
MHTYYDHITELIHACIPQLDKDTIKSQLQTPKDAQLGDIAFPTFVCAKVLQTSPQHIATTLAQQLNDPLIERVQAVGPYVNIMLQPARIAQDVLQASLTPLPKNNKVVLIESPGPNTNKPLHLGHLRNMLLGMTLHHMYAFCGYTVKQVNVVNDRGVHICKSMYAYQQLGNNQTPASTNTKPDHFVGEYYVKYASLANDDTEQAIQDMLVLWEQGDTHIRALWKQMNEWAYQGWEQTYRRLDFSIEKEYYESDTYEYGKDIVVQGVQDGVFHKDEKGAVIADLTSYGLDKKVLLRPNGTSVYITQDIYMATLRYDEFHFDHMIYVVGNEQEYHFQALFSVFDMLGYPFATSCIHFSYGMVELPDGKMKSREGTVVDVDDVLDDVSNYALQELRQRYPQLASQELTHRAQVISNAAIRFFFLKHDPKKNFVFDKHQSLQFEGETGPYVLYTYARMQSILRKAGYVPTQSIDYSVLTEEKEILLLISQAQHHIEQACSGLRPHSLAQYILQLAQWFNAYYSKHKIIQDDARIQQARCAVLETLSHTIKTCLALLHMQTLDHM